MNKTPIHLLVIGSGGREHALVDHFHHSPSVKKIFLLPGNDGIKNSEKLIKVPWPDESVSQALMALIKKEKIELVIIGAEKYLAEGLVNQLQSAGIRVLGPTKKAAQLESSKSFAKMMMEERGVKTAPFVCFDQGYHHEDEEHFLKKIKKFLQHTSWWEEGGVVFKADQLAQGKGVFVCQHQDQVEEALKHLMTLPLPENSSRKILIEKYIQGKELSAFFLCHGESFITLGMAVDYKRLNDGDKGPNTGGMGAYWVHPLSVNEGRLKKHVEEKICRPILQGMKERGEPFHGILFVGLMVGETNHGTKDRDAEIDIDDDVSVLEFNVRLGDPETQVILPMIDEDLIPWLQAASESESALKEMIKQRAESGEGHLRWREGSCVHVVISSHPYPGTFSPRDQRKIILTEKKAASKIFMANVKEVAGELYSDGGRILGVSAWDENQFTAREKAYQQIKQISIPDAHYRLDIGRTNFYGE